MSSSSKTCDQIPTTRRSGNYKPPIWDYDFIHSLSSEYKEEKYLKRASELIFQVNVMLGEEILDVVQQLEFIDDLQRLCISYHFEDKIKHILNYIYDQDYCKNYQTDLYSTALGFRLLRQHGFSVSPDVFDCFKKEHGDFKPSLGDDTKGLLQFYEASFVLTQGEKTLDLAREFATNLLKKKIDQNEGHDDEDLSLLVHNALDIPFHWRIPRQNARFFTGVYGRRQDMKPIVLELAKLDFNIVQATNQEELKHLSSWWKETCLAEKMPFARDMLVEFYYWNFGGIFEPQYGYARIMATKANAFITLMDDMFDVHCTFEEVQLFNNAIQRWDIEGIDKLPYYMQICFLALNNFIDEMAYHVLKEQGFLIIPYLRKTWADLCQAGFQEAKWYSTGYKPKLEEFMSSAWITVSAPAILTHAFFLVTNPIEKEAVQSLYKYHDIVRYSSMIVRFANDLGTTADEMEKGDIPKSIECYMNETGVGRKEAREHIRFLMYEMWKKMNEERVADSLFQPQFVRSVVDLGRLVQHWYQHENGPGDRYPHMKDTITSMFFEPIV